MAAVPSEVPIAVGAGNVVCSECGRSAHVELSTVMYCCALANTCWLSVVLRSQQSEHKTPGHQRLVRISCCVDHLILVLAKKSGAVLLIEKVHFHGTLSTKACSPVIY